MILQIYNTRGIVAEKNGIDSDIQAEFYIPQMLDIYRSRNIIKIILRDNLRDNEGIRCVWTCSPGNTERPKVTKRAIRYNGDWEKNPEEIQI